jgi:hypothetical protein
VISISLNDIGAPPSGLDLRARACRETRDTLLAWLYEIAAYLS